MQHLMGAIFQWVGLFTVGFTLTWIVLTVLDRLGKATGKRRAFRDRINADHLQLQELYNVFWELRERVRIAGTKGYAVREQVDTLERFAEETREVIAILSKKVLDQQERLDLLEQDITSLKRAQGDDSVSLHDLWTAVEQLKQQNADQHYNFSNRLTALEAKQRKAA